MAESEVQVMCRGCRVKASGPTLEAAIDAVEHPADCKILTGEFVDCVPPPLGPWPTVTWPASTHPWLSLSDADLAAVMRAILRGRVYDDDLFRQSDGTWSLYLDAAAEGIPSDLGERMNTWPGTRS